MLELRHVETFWWIATLGSFRAAAEKLHTTQPAVSQRVAALEDTLGVKLFEREGRGARLTPKGQELLSHAERLLQARQDMLLAARDDGVVAGRLRLGVAETLAQTWLPALVQRVQAAHPALTLEIEVETTPVLKRELLARRLDLALLLGPLQEPGVLGLPLCRYPLAWLAAPALAATLGMAAGAPLALAALAAQPVISFAAGTAPHQWLRERYARAGVAAPRLHGCASVAAGARMARAGIGLAVLPSACVAEELARGELVALAVDGEPLPALDFQAAWVGGPGSHAARTVAQLAATVAQGAVGTGGHP